jgi:hypothetical protein
MPRRKTSIKRQVLAVAAAAVAAVTATLLLLPSSAADLFPPLPDVPSNGRWERTDATNYMGMWCPEGSVCVEWCELSGGSEIPTGEFCCLDNYADRDNYYACQNPEGPGY